MIQAEGRKRKNEAVVSKNWSNVVFERLRKNDAVRTENGKYSYFLGKMCISRTKKKVLAVQKGATSILNLSNNLGS